MHQFSRAVGLLYLASGIFLLAFPEAGRRVIQVRAEFAQLSPDALRLLGFAYSLVGALLVATTTPAMEVSLSEAIPPGLRKAA